jgi:membrane glycosyltransferase
VGWGDAARLLWPHTLFGAAVFGLLLAAAPGAALWAALPAGGLLAAIPFCALSASPRLSAWLRARGVAATPEELQGNAAVGGLGTGATAAEAEA